jgi:hypothetical protein
VAEAGYIFQPGDNPHLLCMFWCPMGKFKYSFRVVFSLTLEGI